MPQAPDNPQAQQGEDLTIDDIAVQPSNVPAHSPDPQTIQEQTDLGAQQTRAILSRYEQTTEQRKKFAYLVYWLVVGWILQMFAVLFFQGLGWFSTPLADGVLMWLVGGSTGSILGILSIVVWHLFPKLPN